MSSTMTESVIMTPSTPSTEEALALAQSETLDSLSVSTNSEPTTPQQAFSSQFCRDEHLVAGSSSGHSRYRAVTDDIGERHTSQDIESRRYPLANAKGLLIVIPDSKIDVQAESAFYDEFDIHEERDIRSTRRISQSAPSSPSIFSHDIWLADNSGESQTFARGVSITGWTNVGEKRGGAYIVYDCVIHTSQNITLHAHKRYSSFVQLHQTLKRTLPPALLHNIPSLPPKNMLSKYRAGFLEKRRRMLQQWLAAVLLHPEIGATKEVRDWVVER